MAISIGVGDVLNIRLGYGQGTRPDVAYNVLHYKCSTVSGTPPIMTAQLGAVGQAMFNKWSALWAAFASADIRMENCRAQDVFPLPRSVGTVYVPGAPVPGLVAGDSLPLQDAPTILKTTDYGQRWGIGRMFVVGVPEANTQEGYLEPASLIAIGAMALALKDPVNVALGGWNCTLVPVLIGGPEDNPTRQTPVTGGRLSDIIIKSQKRRRPGKGI